MSGDYKYYYILPIEVVLENENNPEYIDKVWNETMDDVRVSIDGTKCIIKARENLGINYTRYEQTDAELHQIIENEFNEIDEEL